jgi:putative transposase
MARDLIATRDVPVNQACRVVNIDRKTYCYSPKKKMDDTMIENLLKNFSAQYPTYGFVKLFNLIRNQNYTYNHKRIYRIYCDLRLNLKIKPKKRLAPRTKIKLQQPLNINRCWSLDYMSDVLTNGRRIRTANVIDDCNRGALGILVSFSLTSKRITRWLDHLALSRGYPNRIRVDNGPENISHHFQAWAKQHNIFIQYIQPGKPAQNAYIERFNRTYREAVLDMYLFRNIQEVQSITDTWLKHYNEERPHESLNNQSPVNFIKNLHQNFSICAVG